MYLRLQQVRTWWNKSGDLHAWSWEKPGILVFEEGVFARFVLSSLVTVLVLLLVWYVLTCALIFDHLSRLISID